MKTLIFGLGNPLCSDDGIGIRVALELKKDKFFRTENIAIKSGNIEPFDLLAIINGYGHLIIIDAISTEKGRPGDVHYMNLEDLPSYPLRTSHGVDLKTAIMIGKESYEMPKIIDIYAIDIKDGITFRESLTEDLEQKLPAIVNEIAMGIKKDLSLG